MKEAAPTDSNEPTLPRTESDPLKREPVDPPFSADTPLDGWHYVRDGAAEGPLTREALMRLLESGDISADTLVWREGIPYWTPANVVRVLRPAPEVELEAAPPPLPTSVGTERPHPWLRYWARTFDLLLAFLVLQLAYWAREGIVPPEAMPVWTRVAFHVLAVALVSAAEPFMLSAWGTTPGKALLGIRVRTAGDERIGLVLAFKRSGAVLVLGLAGGAPILGLFAMLWQRHLLLTEGATWWDAKLDLRVMHKESAPEMWLRYGAAVLAVLFAASLIGSLLMK